MDQNMYSIIVNNRKAIDKLKGKLDERGIKLSEFKQVIKNFVEVEMNFTNIVGVLNKALEEEQSSRIKQILERELYAKTIADKSSKKGEPSSRIEQILDIESFEKMIEEISNDQARYDNAKDKEIRKGIELLVNEQTWEIVEKREQLSKNKQTLEGGSFGSYVAQLAQNRANSNSNSNKNGCSIM